METKTYVRKPVYVEAVMVTAENLEEAAAWCGGKILDKEGTNYIKVQVERVRTNRHTQAFPGDWLLQNDEGFKVFTPSNFEKHFQPQDGDHYVPSQVCEGAEMVLEPPLIPYGTVTDGEIAYIREQMGLEPAIPDDMGPEATGAEDE